MTRPLLSPGSADALLFDLGRVVLDIDFNKTLACWAGHAGCEPDDIVARFVRDESARLAEFLDHVDIAVSLHGYGRIGRATQLLAGGGNRVLATHLADHVELPGYHVVTDLDEIPPELRGLHPQNPVNQTRYGGTQLELPIRVRGISPRSPLPGDDRLSPVTSDLVQGLAAAARSWKLPSR